ncbi:hypothetical protein L8P92_14400 [Enterobacter asburiae]|uniref:L,D-transpeptidase family protein n=1 Tax=Enterobacter cloacae complex TaxID=354276 RepID=UPI001BCEBA46|nr:L,D-transpeptidase [Enterobacter asburiae]EHN8905995.1 L,D-transpeptidase [Enterobacter asburiae]MCK6689470.1 hypothetical protein [Enterobacter asburiae]MCK6839497.1 hypothetical protein [Enterobacter asburiae]MCK6996931.1 hypothetical protein [Enterobacter asburiae]MCK7063099.1 hypothetical protein [Enterobacter asburiae]
MARLTFDGCAHTLSLLGSDGSIVDKWTAYNNVDRRATFKHISNGTYQIQDKSKPHLHPGDSEDGSYGTYGIIRFSYPGHPGVGVHSGQAHSPYKPGPEHPTMGCIRTTDEAMKKIKEHMAKSSLSTITVSNNSACSAMSATQKFENIYIPPGMNLI